MKKTVLLVCCIVLATGCSFLSNESDSPDDTSQPRGSEQAAPLVEQWPHELPTITEDNASIQAGLLDPTTSRGWYVAGSMNLASERRSAPFVLHSPNGTDGKRIELPTDGATLGSVYQLHLDDDNDLMAVGQLVDADGRRAAVWNKKNDVWELETLTGPTDRPFLSEITSDSQIVYGSGERGDYNFPVAWRQTTDGWEPVEFDVGGKEDVDFTLAALDLQPNGNLLGVGWRTEEGATSPIFWREQSGQLVADDVNLPDVEDEGFFSDIEFLPDGTGFISGAETIGNTNSPLFLKQTSSESTWQNQELTIELQRFAENGISLSEMTSSADRIYVSLGNDFLQDPITSSATEGWKFMGFVESEIAPQGIGNSVFDAEGDSLLLGSGDKLARSDDGAWGIVRHPELPVNSDSTGQSDIHVVKGELVVTGATFEKSGVDSIPTPHAWTGTFDQPWASEPIGEKGFRVADSYSSGQRLVVATTAEKFGGWGGALIRPASGLPRQSKEPDRETTFRVLFNSVLSESDGSAIVAGQDLFDGTGQEATLYFLPADGPLQVATISGTLLAGNRPSFDCVAQLNGMYLAVASNELQETQLLTSEDGKTWQAQPLDSTFEQFSYISDCRSTGASITMWGATEDDVSLVASSTDLGSWTISEIGGPKDAVNEVLDVDGTLLALGEITGPSEKTIGAIWFQESGEWQRLTNGDAPTGFEPDEFSYGTSIWNAVEFEGKVVFMGNDRSQVGLWHMPKADLLTLTS